MPANPSARAVSSDPYGLLSTGKSVERITLESSTLRVEVITWGARIASIRSNDHAGQPGEVVLGFDDVADYESDRDYLGACVGRFANRIAGGTFTLDGTRHELPTNEGPTTLHGGPEGFDRRLWKAEVGPAPSSVRLHRVSDDREMGFPGRLEVSVTYTVDGNDLVVGYEARTDTPTVVNLTNHTYFNLTGSGTVEHQRIVVDGARFLPVDETLIPTGELSDVEGTPFDLRTATRIGDRVRGGDEQLRRTRGFDHTWVLDDSASEPGGTRRAARVDDPRSGRFLEVWTDRPGIQFYSGNFLDGTLRGRDGLGYRQTDALCLEPHNFPDAPNHDHFPTAVLRPGEVYQARDIYRFGVREPGE